jgi:DNA polymerase III subunit gamma/tau
MLPIDPGPSPHLRAIQSTTSMAYQVLARKYRPTLFSDVVGQDHVTRTLLNALAQNRIAHGYIFSGHRGIGKTTIARILASALNCRTEVGTAKRPTPEPCNDCESCLEIRQGNAVDVIEIDAATNRGIDEIRELRDAARYRPSRDKYKIYILDEAHQITDAAFNALLKTLEEPPDHIIFMMATTQPEDIPQTIRSRCQHFSFHAVKLDDIVGQLQLIAKAEDIVADDATLSLLAEAGDGSMRDALSIMDQAIASAPTVDGRPALSADEVRDLMGTVSNVIYEQVLEAVSENNSADVLAIINRLLDAGNGAQQLARQFVRYLRNCTVAKITNLSPDADATGIAADLLQISPEERKRAARSALLFTEEELSRFLSIMLRTFDDLGFRQEQRFHLELGLLKLVHVQRLLPVEDLLSQLGSAPQSAPRTTPTARATGPAPAPQTSTSRPSTTRQPQQPTTPQPEARSPQPASSQPATLGALALAEAPAPRPAADGPRLVPPTETASTLDLEVLQNAVVDALAATKGQQSASDKLADATFSATADTLTIQTTVSPTMLPLLVNADALNTIKSVLAQHNVKVRLNLLPGEAGAVAAPKPKRAAAAGSVNELAEKHPIVQQARKLFSAEIRNVIDLREKD